MTRKKVAIQLPAIAKAGNIAERYALELEALDRVADLVEVPGASAAEFLAGAADADALITSWGIHIDSQIISGLERCVVIGVGSVGVDMVDVDAATAAGIVVTNVPDVFIEEVADHAMMLLLAAGRRTKQMDQMSGSGDWFKGRPLLSLIPRLMGQTLGLIAFGNVARCVARRAKAFGLHVIAHDPYVSELSISAEGVEPVSLGELIERSDYVSMHAPLNEETRHMLSTAAFMAMKRTAVVINTGRGPTIDEAALIKALRTGEIAAAGLDVLEQRAALSRQSAAGNAQRHHYAARRVGDVAHAPGNAAPRRQRSSAGIERQVADELRESNSIAADHARTVAALPDGSRPEPLRAPTFRCRAARDGTEPTAVRRRSP